MIVVTRRFVTFRQAAVASLITAPLGLAVAASGLSALALNAGNYATAAQLNPLSAEALVRSSQNLSLAPSAAEQANALARASIKRAPLNSDAAATLGYLLRKQQNLGAAQQFMRVAADLSWNNATAQLFMLREANDGFRFEEAVTRADVLLRQRIDRSELLTYLRTLSTYPAAIDPLVRALALRPRWREDYLTDLGKLSAEQTAGYLRLLTRLRATAAPPSENETGAFLSRLVALGLYQEAWQASSKLMPRMQAPLADLGQINDPGEGSPFAWTTANPDVWVRSEPPVAGSAVPGMRISAGGIAAGQFMSRMVVLPPANYRIRVEARFNNPSPSRSIAWQLSCIPQDSIIAEGPVLRASRSGAWQRTEDSVIIPSDCPAQRISVRLEGDSSDEVDASLRRLEVIRSRD